MDNLTREQIEHIVNNVACIFEQELEDTFADYLFDVLGEAKICGYSYCPANALKKVDPIAYREEFNNWLDAQNDIYVEINGDYYYAEQVQDALDSLEESSTYNMAESDLEVNND